MPIMGRGARLGVRASEKGGIRGTKTEDTNGTRNALARERGRLKRTGQHPKSSSKITRTGGIRN